ncbi:LOW QUALITY PROTEIN: A disintegrin and metalloproteinase with thrombospondin motifs adt-2-like [Paramacrobiotus metropolitanus]|uniref:LOW QUALITY PROTEIN: A disintegrin and metalloproteinase with thrombospondin motifs adt-2-like n=1 Tax=Paramacrobiotus metropolitanus TaxID=2943436 RepID=UPI0024456262|nr:LOW QUALITY PROTEIN: A disintegrin and metalloproteinase with thrombospondin motifs adt-2-like [Paramacrobiotus metropolitanus]
MVLTQVTFHVKHNPLAQGKVAIPSGRVPFRAFWCYPAHQQHINLDQRFSTTSQIGLLKARILSQLGLRHPSAYNRYDIVWPALTPCSFSRSPRSPSSPPGSPVLLGMELFGRGMSVYLDRKNLTSPGFQTVLLSAAGVPYLVRSAPHGRQCHYRGRAEICVAGVCQEGSAAISLCQEQDGGLSGYVKIDGDDVQIKPLPAAVSNRLREASGAHLAKRLEPLEHWDELRELNVDMIDGNTLQVPPLLSRSSLVQEIRQRYGFLHDCELVVPPDVLAISDDVATADGGRLQLAIAVFVDQTMAGLLLQQYTTLDEQTNVVLAALNAVQVLFDDDSFGQPKVRIVVKRIIIDQTGKTFKGDGEAEQYLLDFCQYQDQLGSAVGGTDWDVTVALTRLDIYGVLDDVRKDQMDAGIQFPDNRVYGVTGCIFVGGACRAHRNCVIAEFRKENGNVDTIALEVGEYQNETFFSNTRISSLYSGNIMSLSSAKQRLGWSVCSVKSFHDFLTNGTGHRLHAHSDEPEVAALTNG